MLEALPAYNPKIQPPFWKHDNREGSQLIIRVNQDNKYTFSPIKIFSKLQ